MQEMLRLLFSLLPTLGIGWGGRCIGLAETELGDVINLGNFTQGYTMSISVN